MQFKSLIAALVLPCAAGLIPDASAAPAPTTVPTGPAALAAGTGAVQVSEVIVVRRRHRRHGYYTTRRVVYRHGRRVVIYQRHYR